jgi:hypothetical protein
LVPDITVPSRPTYTCFLKLVVDAAVIKETEGFGIDVFAVFVWSLTGLWLALTVPILTVVDWRFKLLGEGEFGTMSV